MRRLKRCFYGLVLLLAIAICTTAAPQSALAVSSGNQASQQIVLNTPPAQVFPLAQQAFEDWSRGEFVAADEASLQVKGLSRTNVFKFVDDLAVTLNPDSADPTKTDLAIVSAGRLGEYDFGGNQRNIDEYLATLRSLLENAPS